MNHILKYRKSIVDAKREWDKIQPKLGTERVIDDKSEISKNVIQRQKELGIYGGAIALLSKAESKPFLLYSPDVQKHFGINDMSDYEYLKTPYGLQWIAKDLNYFIDLLFFISRDTDYPEYIKNIKNQDPNRFEYPFQTKLRTEFEILHCSSGEILFFSILWRLMIDIAIKSKNLENEYNPDLFKLISNDSDWIEVFGTAKGKLVEEMLIQKLNDAERNFKENRQFNYNDSLINQSVINAKDLIQKFISDSKTIDDIFIQLNIFEPTALVELNKYVDYVFSGAVPTLVTSNVNDFTEKAIKAFINKIDPAPNNYTIGDLLIRIHDEARFPILPYYFLLLFDSVKKLKEHIVFPLWYTFSSNTQYSYNEKKDTESAILHALYTIQPIWEMEKINCMNWYTNDNTTSSSNFKPCFEKYITDLFSLFSSMSKPIIDQAYYAEQRKYDMKLITKQATKAAISQVMARNMSHNIGSHVLSKFKSALDISQYYRHEEIQTLRSNTGIVTNYEGKVDTENRDEFQYNPDALDLNTRGLKEIDKIAYFNEYLKSRMDFLADIATSDPSMENSMYFLREVMKGFDRNRILLDRISGVIGKLKFKIEVRLKRNNQWHQLKGEENPFDPVVSMPNDILGSQAFYIILENIIRNVAKHSKLSDNNFTIFVDIEDSNINQNFYALSIYDSICKSEDFINELVAKRNDAFNLSILDSNGKLRNGNLGTIEMDVCAAYLRKLPLSRIEEDLFTVNEEHSNIDENKIITPNLIYAFKHYHEILEHPECYSLGYKLCFRKPQTLLIVDDKETLALSIEAKTELKKFGIRIIKQTDKHEIYNHQFLIWLNDEDNAEFVKKYYGILPKRVLSVFELKFKMDFTKMSANDVLQNVWISYGVQLSSQHNIDIIDYEVKERTNLWPLSGKETGSVLKAVNGDHGNGWYKFRKEKDVYYELICSHHRYSNIKDRLFRNKNLQIEYSESILTRALIIDERIQSNVLGSESGEGASKYSTNVGPILFGELFSKENIFIPSYLEANLNALNFGSLSSMDEEVSTEADKIRKFIKDNIKNAEFCVIHLGVLEKMLSVNEKKDGKAIEKLLRAMFDYNIQEDRKIIITSGRGKPQNLPIGLSFVSLAVLQNAIETLFDKFLLTKILFNSRESL